MKAIVFLGDEAWAAGFRLAGLTTPAVEAGREVEAFVRARAEAALLLVDAPFAARLGADTLQAALDAGRPPLLVLPGRVGGLPAGDPAPAVRRLLGLEQ